MMEELSTAIANVESHPEISILILRGSEKTFSAGVDVAAHTPDKVAEMLTQFHGIFRALVVSKKVLVAEVRGHCLGGGAELAMMCDLVITSDTATWGFPEIQLGCFPPVAVTALASIIGQKRAADLILTGRKFSGREASLLGLANAAVSDAEVGSKVNEIVTHLATLSPAALAATKRGTVRLGRDALRQRPGPCREDLPRRTDANRRCPRRHSGISREAYSPLEREVSHHD